MRAMLLLLLGALSACSVTPKNDGASTEYGEYLRSIHAPAQFVDDPSNARDFQDLADGFRSGRFPLSFAPQLSEKRKNILGLQAYAEQDPSLRDGRVTLRDEIKAMLARHEHRDRVGADYTEGLSNVDTIEDIHILILLKKYANFFSRNDIVAQYPKLFSLANGGEAGGLILWSKDGIQLAPLRSFNDDEDMVRLSVGMEYFYRIPALIYHVPSVGLFHTHPIEPSVDPSDRAGPSCSCVYGKHLTNEAADVDTTVAKVLSRTNPHFIHVVITDLGHAYYNVDAYFFDLHARATGDAVNASEITVIDLGVFHAPK